LKIGEINEEELAKFIEEWADGVGTKLLCRTLAG